MSVFESLRGNGRILELGRASFIDLPFRLDDEPEVIKSQLVVQRSESGSVETQPGSLYDKIKLSLEGITAELRDRLSLLYHRSLSSGSPIELRRDVTRYFHLAGENEIDSRNRQVPIAGYGFSPEATGGRYGHGAIFISPEDPIINHTNLIPNSDFLDGDVGSLPTGWFNETPSTLSATRSLYFRPNGLTGSCIKFSGIGAGLKIAHIDFSLYTLAVNTLGATGLTLSMLIRSDRPTDVSMTNLVDVDFIIISLVDARQNYLATPVSQWDRVQAHTSFAGETATDTTLRLRFYFSEGLMVAPVYATEIQVEPRNYRTGFIPFSTAAGRSATVTGSRDNDLLTYVNGLSYFSQTYAWATAARWGFTVAFDFAPGWSTATFPGSLLHLYNDGDLANVGTIPALSITVTSSTIVATAALATGSTITATATSIGWIANGEAHILATFRDWDGSTPNSGVLSLYVNGILAQSTTHSSRGSRQGEIFWLGTRPDGLFHARGAFSNLQIDPVYVDNMTTDFLVSDYYNASVMPHRDRNGWRCVMSPGHDGEPVTLKNNINSISIQLDEAR